MGESLRNYSKSANRALEVLSYLAAVGVPSRAAEIADALGMARSSADQLLKTMVSGGYLVLSAEDKTYFPSLRLVSVGRWMAGCYPAEPRLRGLVEDLHSQTGDIVTVTMETDCFMQIMARERAGDTDPKLNVGYRVPVIGSAIGGAALTTKSKGEIRKIASRARRQRAVMDDDGSLGKLMDRVNLYRATGYSSRRTLRQVDEAAAPLDYWSIGVSLPTHQNGASVVLGLSGPTEKVRPREGQIVGLMRDTISRHLAA
jgi:DNA-binding IclR family transcriptional regulator